MPESSGLPRGTSERDGRREALFDAPAETADQRFARRRREHLELALTGFAVGQLVRVNETSEAFEYGGDCPFGGTVERVSDGEVDVRFYAQGEDGEWSWDTWTFAVADVKAVDR